MANGITDAVSTVVNGIFSGIWAGISIIVIALTIFGIVAWKLGWIFPTDNK